MRHKASDGGDMLVLQVLTFGMPQPLYPAIQQHNARIDSLRSAPLRNQFGCHLLPALPFGANQRIVGQLHVVEQHFRKMRIAGQIHNGSHRHAGQIQVND